MATIDVPLLQRRIIRLEADVTAYRDTWLQTLSDLQRALIIADGALRCLHGSNAWTKQEQIDARDAIKDLQNNYEGSLLDDE